MAVDPGPSQGMGGGAADQLQMLLVDRRPLFLAALAELLTSARPQARVESTTDSERAVELVSRTPIHLVFCDVRAQPLGGPELVARVNSQNRSTRVILLGDADEDGALLIDSLSCGAHGFFTKSASPEEFLEGVDAVLAGHTVVGRDLVHYGPNPGQPPRGN